MYLGIDVGTSGVKVVLMDDSNQVIEQETAELEVSRPQPLWSEQNPEHWWQATVKAIEGLKQKRSKEFGAVKAIGLAGQMHGATLLDKSGQVIRPAILWNDGRSGEQCKQLESKVTNFRTVSGNLAMPGFTAPKLLWVEQNEPNNFKRVAKVLLPKDYIRWRLSGEYASDMSDSAGTCWLDVGKRKWSPEILAATNLTEDHMPKLYEGTDVTGYLRSDLASQWGLPTKVAIAGGAGDNAGGAVGVGVTVPGRAFLSLGTSGVLFVANDAFRPNPEKTVHAFCHCLPGQWHQMSVILSAASALSWYADIHGDENPERLVNEAAASKALNNPNRVYFLPYLSGERTPHNNPYATGSFIGLTGGTTRNDLVTAIMEGVAFAFADGMQVLQETGAKIDTISVIGGGRRWPYWGRMLASVLGQNMTYHEGTDVGPSLGAARLAKIAHTNADPKTVCTAPPIKQVIQPEAPLRSMMLERLEKWRDMYARTGDLFVPKSADKVVSGGFGKQTKAAC